MAQQIDLGTPTKEKEELMNNNDDDNDGPMPSPEMKLFRMKSVDEHGNNCVVYQDPDSPVVSLVVRVGLTLYDMGSFNVAEASVPAVFDIWLVYDNEIYLELFGNTRNGKLPFTCPNVLEMDITRYGSYIMYGNDLKTINQWTKRQKVEDNEDLRAFRVETYSCRGSLKLTTFPAQDPFQAIYIVFKIAMDGTPGSEMTQYLPSPGINYTIISISLFSFLYFLCCF